MRKTSFKSLWNHTKSPAAKMMFSPTPLTLSCGRYLHCSLPLHWHSHVGDIYAVLSPPLTLSCGRYLRCSLPFHWHSHVGDIYAVLSLSTDTLMWEIVTLFFPPTPRLSCGRYLRCRLSLHWHSHVGDIYALLSPLLTLSCGRRLRWSKFLI